MTRRIARITALGLAALLLVTVSYVLLLGHPELLFDKQIERGDFALYARQRIDTGIAQVLDTAQTRLIASPLYRSGRRRVFITGSSRWHAFFTGPGYRAMAKNFELGNSIYIPSLDSTATHIVHFDSRRALLAPVLVHEAAHTDLQRHVGLLRLWRLPFWKREGYSEMVAYGDTMTVADVRRLLSSPGQIVQRLPDMPVPRWYYEAEAAWRFLVQYRGATIDQVLTTNEPLPVIVDQIRNAR